MKILLDMDGVQTDLVKAVLNLLGKKFSSWNNDIEKHWPKGVYSFEEATGIPNEIIWKLVESEGISFWSEMDEFVWSKKLYKELSELGEVHFCTCPTEDTFSALGKIEWMQERFGKGFRNYVLTQNKHLLANEDTILVDDCDAFVSKFRVAGGKAVLFPQPWNMLHYDTANRVRKVIDKVKHYIGVKDGL